MSPRLALSRALVTVDGDPTQVIHHQVSVVAQNDGTLVVTDRTGQQVAHLTQTSIDRRTVDSWAVTTADGPVLLVSRMARASGCGCGS